MSQFEDLRRRLNERYEEIAARLQKVNSDIRHVNQPLDRIMDEQSIELENDDVLEALDDSMRVELEHIERTLGRIDAGNYGLCELCGSAISLKRLEALPFATRCVECEAVSEARQSK